MMELQKLFIGGRSVGATSGETFENVNPATGEPLCEVQIADEKDVDSAVRAAHKGFQVWSSMPPAERGRVLSRAARLLRERNDQLARLEVLDTGKPISEALSVDITSGADCLAFYAGLAAGIRGEHIDLGGSFVYTRREPLGVCAGIGAWNYPLQIACWKSAPALACGNAVIFKPSELTPLTARKLAEVYAEAGLPDGVFNLVHGKAQTGQALVRHPGIAKISLTGSVPTGKAIMRAAAATLKHVTLELGGKSPLLVFADSNLDNAVSAAMMGNFYTQGEICSNCTRVFVEAPVLDTFLDKLLARVSRLKVGDPLDPATQIGSLISRGHLEKVLGYIDTGVREGAAKRCGGRRLTGDGLEKGFFVEPTVFSACTDEMTIVREEIFGPVMSVLTFTREDEAISRANDTNYGLCAGVFTNDLQRAHRVVSRLQAGTCWINNYNLTPVEMPFGGYKHSGLGRENGLAAIEHYSQIKSVYVELGDVDAPF